MIDVELARWLHLAGVPWQPQRGDRFVVSDRDMDDDVFVVSDMVIEVHQGPRGSFMGFNGTTEWAMDSVDTDDVVWLPREDQLRVLLGPAFVRLALGGPDGSTAVVTADVAGERRDFEDHDVESAYARALLALRQAG